MTLEQPINNNPYFAWHPLKTECGSWVWLVWVREEIDYTGCYFKGFPTIKYHKI